jgi:hypothetical protein
MRQDFLFAGCWILHGMMMFREGARMHWEVSLYYSIIQIDRSQCVCASPLLIENPDTVNRLSFRPLYNAWCWCCLHRARVLVSADTAVWFMLLSCLCLPSSASATLSFLWRTLLLWSSTTSAWTRDPLFGDISKNGYTPKSGLAVRNEFPNPALHEKNCVQAKTFLHNWIV